MKRVLIRFNHGLGDVAQASVLLKHLRKYRPDWVVDFRCLRGKHTAVIGLCNKVYHEQEPEPPGPYDEVIDISFWENYNGYTDRPNSKVTNCLQEVFGIPYDPELGRYEVNVSATAYQRAADYLASIGCQRQCKAFRIFDLYNVVLVHYEGNTSTWRKNLGHWQARAFCDTILRAGRIPILLDWDRRSPLPDQKTIFNPGTGKDDIWGGFGSGDAEMIAALIRLSEAFVGIDSGPGKVASSTDTPSLICWTGHHPIQFHDPAPNTLHLIPHDWRQMSPCKDKAEIAAYFEKHYQYRTYTGDHGLVAQACRWLKETLGCPDMVDEVKEPKFILPNGIGDAIWALHKIRSIAGDKPIDVLLSGNPSRAIDHRAVPFLKRFPFVRSVDVTDVPVLVDKENPADARGRYNYMPDGVHGGYHFLCPNHALERGQCLEDWLPEYPCDWEVIKEFDWSNTERGTELARALHPFVAFYLGPETGHTEEGHNRGWLWEPKHWVELGREFKERGLNICLVGAEYDRSFWEKWVQEGVGQAGQKWYDLIGMLEIGETFALLKGAKALISYQCGLGIVAHYLGVPVCLWWRPDGDSIHPRRHITFDERMATAWVNPKYRDRYLGLIYKKESPADIIREIDRRGWLKT